MLPMVANSATVGWIEIHKRQISSQVARTHCHFAIDNWVRVTTSSYHLLQLMQLLWAPLCKLVI